MKNKILYFALILLFGINTYNVSLATENSRFTKIVKKAAKEEWNKLPYNDIIVKVGKEFLGVPYVGGTLDKSDSESCVIDLDRLDCVTYFENCLAIADVIMTEDNPAFDQLYERVQYTRYRNGDIDGYESRLHYTADWIFDNIDKEIVNDITSDLGGIPLDLHVNFMSQNADKYPKLKGNKVLIEKIKKIEDDINSGQIYFIPKENVSDIMDKLENGDIVAFVTSIEGLDYGHIGLINKEDGTARLMHASSTAKKVMIDKPLDQYINGVSKFTGITVLRPISPIK